MTDERKIRILLVDDNEIDIIVNTKLLKISKITRDVISFMGSDEVVAYVEENKEELKGISTIVLMDIQMPEIDGFGCIELMVERFPELLGNLSLYMLSSSIDRNDIKRAESNEHILKVLEKPLDVYQLKRLIEDEFDL